MAQASRPCLGCGTIIHRTGPTAPIQHRCDPCRRKHRAAQEMARYVPVVQVRMCQDCGEGYQAPGRDTKSLRCPPCRFRSRAEKLKAWAEEHPDTARRSKRRWHEANRAYVKASKHARRVLTRDVEAERFTALEIFERDDWTCQICRERLDPLVKFPDNRSASLDHVVPVSRGGAHTRANVQTACMGCNRRKGGRLAH